MLDEFGKQQAAFEAAEDEKSAHTAALTAAAAAGADVADASDAAAAAAAPDPESQNDESSSAESSGACNSSVDSVTLHDEARLVLQTGLIYTTAARMKKWAILAHMRDAACAGEQVLCTT